jgi:aminopeptidase N
LFDLQGDKIVLSEKTPVNYSGAATEVPALVGKACPALVYPNYEDWGFAKVTLDEKSFATARSSLSHTDDVMLRSMLWQSLSDGMRGSASRCPPTSMRCSPTRRRKRDPALVRPGADGGWPGAQGSPARSTGQGASRRTQVRRRSRQAPEEHALGPACWAHSGAARPGAGLVLHLPSKVAGSKGALKTCARSWMARRRATASSIDQEYRWSINRAAQTASTRPGSQALIAAELARDGSESGQLAAIAATVVRPDAKTKAEWLAKIQAMPTDDLPYAKLRVAMGNLYPSGQESFDEASAAQRLESMAKIDAAADRVFMRSYGSMVPATCTPASVARLEQAKASMAGLSEGVRRDIVSSLEADRRCVATRAKFESGL